jgi:hypothetical protein
MSSLRALGRGVVIAFRFRTTTIASLYPNPSPRRFHYNPHRNLLNHSSPLSMESAAAARVSTSTVSNGEGGDGFIRFPLSPSSSLVIQKGDITQWFIDAKTDAIVGASLSLFLSQAVD